MGMFLYDAADNSKLLSVLWPYAYRHKTVKTLLSAPTLKKYTVEKNLNYGKNVIPCSFSYHGEKETNLDVQH